MYKNKVRKTLNIEYQISLDQVIFQNPPNLQHVKSTITRYFTAQFSCSNLFKTLANYLNTLKNLYD